MPRGKCIFNSELSKKYPFLKKSNKKNATDSDVHCDLCNCEFSLANAGKTDIEKHLQTIKHKKALQSVSSSRTMTQFFASSGDKGLAACEGVWAYHVVQSNHSFLSSDCASKLFRQCFKINKFHCGQTRGRAIATNVFAPYARNVLKNDLAKRHYITVSTDASNHGNVKMMPVVVRYFDPTVGVKVKMLEFSSEKGAPSEIIASLIMRAAEKNQITDKIVGFCGDNCATNFGNSARGGQNNVYYRLKQSNPSLIGVGCSAHIVHNAIKHACLLLPVNIENIVVTIYSHFYINTVRVEVAMRIDWNWVHKAVGVCENAILSTWTGDWIDSKAVRATSRILPGTQALSTESSRVFHFTSLKTVATVCERTGNPAFNTLRGIRLVIFFVYFNRSTIGWIFSPNYSENWKWQRRGYRRSSRNGRLTRQYYAPQRFEVLTSENRSWKPMATTKKRLKKFSYVFSVLIEFNF